MVSANLLAQNVRAHTWVISFKGFGKLGISRWRILISFSFSNNHVCHSRTVQLLFDTTVRILCLISCCWHLSPVQNPKRFWNDNDAMTSTVYLYSYWGLSGGGERAWSLNYHCIHSPKSSGLPTFSPIFLIKIAVYPFAIGSSVTTEDIANIFATGIWKLRWKIGSWALNILTHGAPLLRCWNLS